MATRNMPVVKPGVKLPANICKPLSVPANWINQCRTPSGRVDWPAIRLLAEVAARGGKAPVKSLAYATSRSARATRRALAALEALGAITRAQVPVVGRSGRMRGSYTLIRLLWPTADKQCLLVDGSREHARQPAVAAVEAALVYRLRLKATWVVDYAWLCRRTGLSRRSVERGLRELRQRGTLSLAQAHAYGHKVLLASRPEGSLRSIPPNMAARSIPPNMAALLNRRNTGEQEGTEGVPSLEKASEVAGADAGYSNASEDWAGKGIIQAVNKHLESGDPRTDFCLLASSSVCTPADVTAELIAIRAGQPATPIFAGLTTGIDLASPLEQACWAKLLATCQRAAQPGGLAVDELATEILRQATCHPDRLLISAIDRLVGRVVTSWLRHGRPSIYPLVSLSHGCDLVRLLLDILAPPPKPVESPSLEATEQPLVRPSETLAACLRLARDWKASNPSLSANPN